MIKFQLKYGQHSSSGNSPLKRTQLIDFLNLSGQLLKNGFSAQAIILTSLDLEIISGNQAALIQDQLQQGASLVCALSQLIRSPSLLAQLEIAERHGDLATCCLENAGLIEEQQRQLRQLKGLLIYPCLLLVLLGSLLVLIKLVIKPQLAALLPAESTSSSAMRWMLIITGLLILLGLWLHFHSTRIQQQELILRTPIIGRIFRFYVNYLIFTDLNYLLASGLSLQEILDFTKKFSSESLQGQLAIRVSQQLLKGQSLEKIINSQPMLPKELQLLLAQNRESSYRQVELQLLARRNYQKLNQSLRTLIDQVQPVLFVLIAIMVGTMYLQLLTPIYQMMKGF